LETWVAAVPGMANVMPVKKEEAMRIEVVSFMVAEYCRASIL
jgi:hypothetical protein